VRITDPAGAAIRLLPKALLGSSLLPSFFPLEERGGRGEKTLQKGRTPNGATIPPAITKTESRT
jgi:hypothetical protein